jgi:transposase-like protein
VGLGTAFRRVDEALKKKPSLLERTKKHLDECDGVLVLDGKWIYIRGKLHTCFVAWDRGFKRPIHFLLKEGGERELWYWRLLLDLEKIGYVPKGFVSDGISSLKESLADRYPDLPHQRCTVHVFLAARAKVTGGGQVDERATEFIERLRSILWSRTLRGAKQKFQICWNKKCLTRGEREALKFIWPTLPECFVCRDERWKHLRLPRSSNAIENVIGNIEARAKTRRGAKNLPAMERLVNEILLQVSPQTINQ